MMTEPLLSLNSVSIGYRTSAGVVRAVEDVTLDVAKGEAVGLVGESGSGKTSLGTALIRTLPDNATQPGGQAVFDGNDLFALSESEMRRFRWSRIAMVFQAAMSAFSPVSTVRSQIVETIQAHEGVSYREASERVGQLFAMVDMAPEVAGRYPHQLSGGMRQRAVIAMALACNPDFIIADEPTTALDVIVQQRVIASLRDVQQTRGLGMIVISHDLGVVAQLCSRIAVMYAGRLVEIADSEQLFESPRHPYTKALVDAIPSIRGDKKELVALGGEPPDLLNPPSGCPFAPRCATATPECSEAIPPMANDGARQFACWHPLEK